MNNLYQTKETNFSNINSMNKNNEYSLEILSLPDSFSIDIFEDMDWDELKDKKCKYCDKISLNPKVYIKVNDTGNFNNRTIICSECFGRTESTLENMSFDQNYSDTLKNTIEAYRVKCPNYCNWKGLFSSLIKHLKNECKYQRLKCPKKECNKHFVRKNLLKHLNTCIYNTKIKCTYCKEEIEKDDNNHLNICREFILDCQYNCGKKVKRKDLEYHKNNCPEYILKCPYYEFGCKDDVKRKDMKEHNRKRINEHFRAVKLKMENMSKKDKDYIKAKQKYEKLEQEIKEIEEEDLKRIKLREEIYGKDIEDEWNDIVKKYENKNKKKKVNDLEKFYIPFTGEAITFCAESDDITNKKIIMFEPEIIKYSGNYFNNLEKEKKYFVFSNKALELDKDTNFEFKIEKVDNNGLPWIAIGICANENCFQKDLFPKGFYYMDLNSNICYDGLIEDAEDEDKLDLNTSIMISYFPKDKILIIKDNNGYDVTFPNIPNDNPNIRLCFIFKGNYRAVINYK